MLINKLICVNWGNIPNREFDLGTLTLFTGGSGSGKTTTADAIQTVLTAAKRGLFAYNPGQDESTQFGRGGKLPRTLGSYVLGADDYNFARPDGAHGYVAVIFGASPGEPQDHCFTAVVAVTASLQEEKLANGRRRRVPKDDKLHLIIVEGQKLQLDDFVTERSEKGMSILPTDTALVTLRKKYGKTVVHDFQNNKKSYLNKLYGLLRGRRTVSTTEAEQAARAFSKFMAYKPIENINDFVRQDILEPQDISEEIMRISTLMRKVFDLRSEAERLQNNINVLENIESHGRAMRQAWYERREQLLCLAMKKHRDTQLVMDFNRNGIEQLNTEEQRLNEQSKDVQHQLQELDLERLSIERMRQQHEAAGEKDRLLVQLKRLQDEASHTFKVVLDEVDKLRKDKEFASQIVNCKTYIQENPRLSDSIRRLKLLQSQLESYDFEGINADCTQLASQQDSIDPQTCAGLKNKIESLDDITLKLLHQVTDEHTGLRSLSDREIGALANEISQADNNFRDLERKITKIREQGLVEYPYATRLALQAIQQELPAAHPQVLCDLIEVKDEHWQAPIEAYMGFNRFGIIVDAQYEAQAIQLVKTLPKRGAQVIQGEKAMRDAARIGLPLQSIVHEFVVQHPVARAYLSASYGNVLKVDSVENLRHTPRGITQDGHGSTSYKMFVCQLDDHELVFGKQARDRAIYAMDQQLANLDIEQKRLQDSRTDLMKINALCRDIQSTNLLAATQRLQNLSEEIHDINKQLQRLDLSNIEELETAIKDIQQRKELLEDKYKSTIERTGEIKVERNQKTSVIEQMGESLQNLDQELNMRKTDVEKLKRHDPDYEVKAVFLRLEQEAQSPANRAKGVIEKRIDDAQQKINSSKSRFKRSLLEDYNQKVKHSERIELQLEQIDDYARTGTDFYAVMDAYTQVQTQLRRQRDIGLAEVKDRLQKAQESIQSVFTANFCQMIYDAIIRGEDKLRQLNDELKGHHFGDDHYYFDWDWVPEYKRYYQFFKTVMEMESLGEGQDLFDDEHLSKDLLEVRDEITDLLLSDDPEFSHKRLTEIGDYRNYRRYEIYKSTGRGDPVPLSEYGTGSGGQLETPAYVIRAAAVASAFRLREGDTHLRTVLIDESFAKMDETRAKSILRYLTEGLNFQVNFIMPTKSAGAFQPIITDKMVFVKIKSKQAPGEMGTITHVDCQKINREAVEKLWQDHREQVRQNVILNYDDDSNNNHSIN